MNRENEMEDRELTRLVYEKHGVEYTEYKGLNRFYGTPVPKGYKAIYVNDGVIPDSLQLVRIDEKVYDNRDSEQ